MSSQPYELTHQDVLNCRFDQWHPLFSSRTFASQVIPLPEEFLAYLQADGIDASGSAFPEAPSQLRGWSAPRPEKSVADFARECGFAIQSLSSSGSDDGENIETQVEATRARKAKGKESGAAFYSLDSFKALDAKIRDALDQLDGEAFPKLSWSAPLDAVWIGEQQSLKCTEPQHVYLLLKASDRVSHDLTSAYDHCPAQPPAGLCGQLLAQQFLVLRRWFRLDHGMEFRCFVRNGSLVAVSQRHDDIFFDFLPAIQASVLSTAGAFLAEVVLPAFPSSSFSVDLYRDRRDRFWIVDFNPWSPQVTSSLLFTWTELSSLPSSPPAIRVLEHPAQIRPPRRSPILDMAAAAAVITRPPQ